MVTDYRIKEYYKMKNIKYIVALAAVLFVAAQTRAQHTISGYFTDGYMYRHEINPARIISLSPLSVT